MSLLQMSLSGAVMIAAVIIIRALTINRLPKKTFLVLWGIVLLRLLVPFSVSSGLSVYSLLDQSEAGTLPGQAVFTESGGDDSDLPTVSESGDSKNDSHVINGKNTSSGYVPNAILGMGDQTKYESDTGVILKKGDRLPGSSDEGFSSDVSENTSIQNDTSVSLKQTLQNKIWHAWACIRQFRIQCLVIWCAGVILCTVYFTGSYFRCRFEFQASLPVENAFVQGWVQEHARRRPVSALTARNARIQKWLETQPRRISVRQSDRVSTPLTYGIFHPVILMPKNTDWENRQQLRYILTHEYVHIRRCDVLTKLLAAGALCVHWFNPMVWIMWILFNRDVEIACDESVVRRMGESVKSAYAMMLIQMEAERSGVAPLCSGLLSKLGKNAMEERITAIMKMKKKSMPAGIAAAVLVISVTAAFATSAAENKNTDKMDNTADFTEQEYEMLFALQFDGYEAMTISEYRDKVWSLTDTAKYNDVIERFFQDEAIYAKYETAKGTDSNETADFLYTVLGPLMTGRQTISFNGYAMADFASASENASLEYTATMKILDADQLTVAEYISARHGIERDMEDCLRGLSVSELRDEEMMKVFIDETVLNITMTYQNMHADIEYVYRPLEGVPVDDMEDWQKERRDGWEKMMAPYVPFGLTCSYDWDTDDYKMYFDGKEVRGIYDGEENVWITEHMGIGEGIYDADAIELFAVYENHRITGLREATAKEMAEITARRQAATDEYKNEYQEIRRTVPAAEEDYQSLFALKTSDYRQKSIADFNMEYLDWCNEDHERMERIGEDRGWKDYRVALTDEEKSFVEVTTWLSGMENGAYIRSLNKNEPEQDICSNICLSNKEENAQNGYGLAWCSLDYCFSYHISDRDTVSIGERDGQIGKMVREIQERWDSSDIDEIVQMTESDMLEWLHAVAAKYSNRKITITIVDDRTQFECMDERGIR